MSKETKFGYGFLLVGVGAPFLISEIFGFNATVVVVSFCTVVGIALLIAGHRHKEERMRRGVMATIGFYTLVGLLVGASTGAIAGTVIVLKQKFRPEVTTETDDKAKGKEDKSNPPKSSEVAEAHSEKGTASGPHIKNVLSPYARTESFIIDVPYYGGEDGFPVHALLDDEDYPLNDVYGCIVSVLVLYAQPGSTQINQIATLDTNDKRAEALVQALRYCVIDQLHQCERGSSKFGISVTKASVVR